MKSKPSFQTQILPIDAVRKPYIMYVSLKEYQRLRLTIKEFDAEFKIGSTIIDQPYFLKQISASLSNEELTVLKISYSTLTVGHLKKD